MKAIIVDDVYNSASSHVPQGRECYGWCNIIHLCIAIVTYDEHMFRDGKSTCLLLQCVRADYHVCCTNYMYLYVQSVEKSSHCSLPSNTVLNRGVAEMLLIIVFRHRVSSTEVANALIVIVRNMRKLY